MCDNTQNRPPKKRQFLVYSLFYFKDVSPCLLYVKYSIFKTTFFMYRHTAYTITYSPVNEAVSQSNFLKSLLLHVLAFDLNASMS